MKKNIILAAGIFSIILFSGCSTMKVTQVDKKHKLEYVCIEDNPKVKVDDFIPTVEKIFHDYGIATDVYAKNKVPAYCDVKMKYTALRSWDIGTYLSFAEVNLYKGRKSVGHAEYGMTGKGGLDLSKWASVKSKMTPVIEKLLSQYDKKEITFDKDKYKKDRAKRSVKTKNTGLTLEDKLKKIKKMKEDGVISTEEYLKKREQLIDSY